METEDIKKVFSFVIITKGHLGSTNTRAVNTDITTNEEPTVY
jgi:hypothetical protein